VGSEPGVFFSRAPHCGPCPPAPILWVPPPPPLPRYPPLSLYRSREWWSACLLACLPACLAPYPLFGASRCVCGAVVRSANAVALSMFGYNKRDMLNQNVSMIVPQPMSGVHDGYLQKFVESGRSVRARSLQGLRAFGSARGGGADGFCAPAPKPPAACFWVLVCVCVCVFARVQSVLNTTRTVFGRHRSGALFPILLCVKPMANSFAGVMQKLNTSDQFMLFTTISGRVAGGTQDTLRLVGEAIDLEDVNVPISRFIDDDTLTTLLSAVELAFSKANGARLMKNIQVRCAVRARCECWEG
jgi:hypothetical protein